MTSLLNSNASDTAHGDVFLHFLNQSTEFCRYFKNGQSYCYILLMVFTVTLPVGILGNLAVLINYICLKKTISASNIFLFNLALCDFAWILTIPFSLYFKFQWPYLTSTQIFCRVKEVSFNVNIYGSILFLTLISFDRYVGTVHPISSLHWWGVGKAKVCVVFVWIGLFLSSIPDLFITFAIWRSENVTVCMDHIKGPFRYIKTITVIRTTVGFLLPFCAMLTFYIKMIRALRCLQNARRKRKRKPLQLISAAILVFVFSFVPYHVMAITLIFMQTYNLMTPSNAKVLYASYEFCEAICSLNSCLDPVLYIVASEQFRRKLLALKRHWDRRLCCRANRRVGVIGE